MELPAPDLIVRVLESSAAILLAGCVSRIIEWSKQRIPEREEEAEEVLGEEDLSVGVYFG